MAKVVVVTGANRGIGLELVKLYKHRGDEVFGVCRAPSQELIDTSAHIVDGVDVRDVDLQDRLHSHFDRIQIDLLINNAGILRDERFGDLNFDTIQEQFEVNTLGPLRLTEALLNRLSSGAKIALITSRMGSIADNTSGGRYGYRMSKAALNAAGVSLAQDLKAREIAVAILHPGYVATEMVGGRGDISPQIAAERLAQRVEELNLENSGTFWHSNGQRLPW